MRVLLTGAGGFLGRYVDRTLRARGFRVWSTAAEPARRIHLNLTDPGDVATLVAAVQPDAIVHTAAISDVASCEADAAATERINVEAVAELAAAADSEGAWLVFFSTDQVHDGEHAPYADDAAPAPLHAYGRSKAAAEGAVREVGDRCTVLRVALAYGDSPTGRRSATEMVLEAARTGNPAGLFTDELRSPIYAADLAEAVARILERETAGTFNLGGPEALSRHAFGERVCAAYGLDPATIRPVRAADLDLAPPRPRDLRLVSDRLWRALDVEPHTIDDALAALANGADR